MKTFFKNGCAIAVVVCFFTAPLAGGVTLPLETGTSTASAVSPEALLAKQGMQGAAAPNATLADKFADYCSKNPMSCVISALYAAQTIYSMLSAGKAGKTKSDAQTGGGVDSTGTGYTADDVLSNVDPTNVTSTDVSKLTAADPALGSLLGQAKSALDRVKENGVTLNRDGSVTTPNGTIPASALGSIDSLSKALNLSDADKALIQKIGAETAQKAKYSVAGVPTEGGGRGGSQAAGGPSSDGFAKALAGLMDKKARNPAQNNIAGMSKAYGSERIGVAGDNIFQMVSRRYFKMMNDGAFQTLP